MGQVNNAAVRHCFFIAHRKDLLDGRKLRHSNESYKEFRQGVAECETFSVFSKDLSKE